MSHRQMDASLHTATIVVPAELKASLRTGFLHDRNLSSCRMTPESKSYTKMRPLVLPQANCSTCKRERVSE